jgi:hypothetical protein
MDLQVQPQLQILAVVEEEDGIIVVVQVGPEGLDS